MSAKKNKRELVHAERLGKGFDRGAFAGKLVDASVEEALRDVDRLRAAAGKTPLKD